MRKLILILMLILAGCAQVVASNPEQITIKAPPVAEAEAFRKAEDHCNQFNKSAIPSGTVFGNSTVFKCE